MPWPAHAAALSTSKGDWSWNLLGGGGETEHHYSVCIWLGKPHAHDDLTLQVVGEGNLKRGRG